ncbi:LuxR C-terminal-related transcriptional regulator [Microbacterium sp. B2969]|uniref:LuxR C-terminal-related transcriptional regulator n=1 Tax=Microbacterium alkaliflavum TaxID=3248839 RepID=A0ABW7QAU9_9MICO
MADGGVDATADTLRALVETVTAPAHALAERLSLLVSAFVPHDALIVLAADASGGHRVGAGAARFVGGVSYLVLDELRRTGMPDSARRTTLDVDGVGVEVLQLTARNGALLLLAEPRPTGDEAVVLDLWNVVALRVQDLADAAPPLYLQLARASSGERMEALTELSDEYSTTLETVLAALRSASLDDAAARASATAVAAEGLVHLRTASDRVRAFTEEPVTTAFQRLRDDLRPLVRYRDIEVQFVEPPVDGRPLPSEVAHGARAVVRGSILALIENPHVGRVRVQWDCDGTNLLIDMRDDGRGEAVDDSIQLQLTRDRIHALGGHLTRHVTPGWGTEMAIVIPLDPPRSAGGVPVAWALRPREVDVLQRLAAGRRNRDIAAELSISENTVKFHVAGVYRKLGVQSRAEATALYLSRMGSALS